MWNRQLTFDFNFFTSKMEGGLARTSSLYPIYFTQVGYPSSSIIPYVNFNEDKRTGFDFSVYANKKVGEVDLTLGVSGMWYKSTAEKRDENIEFEYLSAVGRPLNGHWGLPITYRVKSRHLAVKLIPLIKGESQRPRNTRSLSSTLPSLF